MVSSSRSGQQCPGTARRGCWPHPGIGERPQSQAVLDVLYQSARDAESGYRAAAFVADVLAEGADAVRVDLEHREGTVLQILIPYSRPRLKKAITFDQMRVSAGQVRVWGEQ
jgi:hypothetical protein